MNVKEAEYLQTMAKGFPRLRLMEAFMYRHHPQMLKAKELINHKTIGDLRNIQTMFSYYNDNPKDIRNHPEIGGAASWMSVAIAYLFHDFYSIANPGECAVL